ncbi:sigma intracellular receptor 2-like [Patiria miniata]|uniref:Sigma intracellular receptor 2 n=1 Tax=Patiria miniata TaxID=46514 RepID=A0A913Z492_PATMI|nr:sigma intracellular receptor 2-like [Patiria miniata]
MARGMTRVLEWVIVLYFTSHILITICVDSQMILPSRLFPQGLRDILTDHCERFKDPLTCTPDPHPWFLSFVYGECLLQFPFFFVAVYAFYKGSCKWIRIPSIIYSVHTMTTLQAILSQILFQDFTNSPSPGPTTTQERLLLSLFFWPYAILPLCILLLVSFSKDYNPSLDTQTNVRAARSTKHKMR